MWAAISKYFHIGRSGILDYQPSELVQHLKESLQLREDWAWEQRMTASGLVPRITATNIRAGLVISFWRDEPIKIETTHESVHLYGEDVDHLAPILYREHKIVIEAIEKESREAKWKLEDEIKASMVKRLKKYLA